MYVCMNTRLIDPTNYTWRPFPRTNTYFFLYLAYEMAMMVSRLPGMPRHRQTPSTLPISRVLRKEGRKGVRDVRAVVKNE